MDVFLAVVAFGSFVIIVRAILLLCYHLSVCMLGKQNAPPSQKAAVVNIDEMTSHSMVAESIG
jgi:hypothetical protein